MECATVGCGKNVYNKKRQLCINCYHRFLRSVNVVKYREQEKIRAARRRKLKPETTKESLKKSYHKYKAERLAEKEIYYKNNKDKILEYKREYCRRDLSKKLKRAVNAKRNTIKLKACPSWADLAAIKEFYKNCPEGYHVDHIVPLKHKLVCGLHVLENLQYLPAELNLKKSNKFDGTLENNSWRNKNVS